MFVRGAAAVVLAALMLAGSGSSAALASSPSASAHAPTIVTYRNCRLLNQRYPHGVGKPGARDHVSGRTKPVTTFYRNVALYNANRARDRDKDGIACEKL